MSLPVLGKKRARCSRWRIRLIVKAFITPKTALGDLDTEAVASLIAAAADMIDFDGRQLRRDIAE